MPGRRAPRGGRPGAASLKKEENKGGRPHLSGWILCFYPCRKGIQEAFERVRSSNDLQTGRTILVGWNLPYLFLSSPCCNARARSLYFHRPKSKTSQPFDWEVWGEAPSLRLGFRGYTPVHEGIQEGSKRLRPRRPLFGRMSLVGSEPPVFSFRLSSFATAMPDRLSNAWDGDRRSPGAARGPFLDAFRTVCRIFPANRPKRNCAPRLVPRGARGEAPFPVGFFGSTPAKGH